MISPSPLPFVAGLTPCPPPPSKERGALVLIHYTEFPIFFDENGWLNATSAATNFGKLAHEWFRLPSTQEYIDALGRDLNTGESLILPPDFWVRTRRGKGGGTWIHPELVVMFARWLDIRFAIWCDRQIRALLSGNHPHFDWKKSRAAAASSYKVMSQALQFARQYLGKPTAPHHYMVEAKLVNGALTGRYAALDRGSLSPGELDLLARLEALNTVLMGMKWTYEERKAELLAFVRGQRSELNG